MTFQAAALAAYAAADGNALAGGSMELIDGGGAIVASVVLNTPASTSVGAVATFAGFPKSTTALSSATIASARLRNLAGAAYKSSIPVGIPGSGAQVIVDNGAGTLAVTTGQSVTVLASPTMTHTA